MPVLKETAKETTFNVEEVKTMQDLISEIGKANRIAQIENMVGIDLGAGDLAMEHAMKLVVMVGQRIGSVMTDEERAAEERGEHAPIDNQEVVCDCPLCEAERALGLK